MYFTWQVRHEGASAASKEHAHDDRDVRIALGEFPRIFSGANSLNLHPLSWLPQSLLVCLAGEQVKELVTTVKEDFNRDNDLEEPQATAPCSTRSIPRPRTSWSSPSSSSSSSAPPSLPAKLASTTWACKPSVRRSLGACCSELRHVLDARCEATARVLISHFCAKLYVSMCGPLGCCPVCPCGRAKWPKKLASHNLYVMYDGMVRMEPLTTHPDARNRARRPSGYLMANPACR